MRSALRGKSSTLNEDLHHTGHTLTLDRIAEAHWLTHIVAEAAPDFDVAHTEPERLHDYIQEARLDDPHWQQVAQSFEGRPIFAYHFGTGPVSVLAWSQMHGDEPTATAALLDVIRVLNSEAFAPIARDWQNKLTLTLLPMLNPDGAARRIRENAQGIDINRDAAALQSPEGQLLNGLLRDIRPDLTFNLHDQNRYYMAGDSGQPSTLAFLAPPGDSAELVLPHRERAMQLIGDLSALLKHFIPEQIARYSDSYSPRAFGDLACALGSSSILIESGYRADDPQRQIARRMTALSVLTACNRLVNNDFSERGRDRYLSLPVNTENGFFDVVLRQLECCYPGNQKPEHRYRVDVGINFNADAGPQARFRSQIEAIGDLRAQGGYFEFDASHYQLVQTLREQDKNWLEQRVSAHFQQFEQFTQGAEGPGSISELFRPMASGEPAFLLLSSGGEQRAAVIDGCIFDASIDQIINNYS